MKKTLFTIGLGIIILASSSFIISSGGITGQTGSPGEGTCANCHSGGGGATTVSISSSPAFTGNQYLPGQNYTVTVSVINSLFAKFGFGCEILNSANANAGTMANAQTGVSFANSGTKTNAIHNIPKTGTGSANFTFEWTAPAAGVGAVTIYAAGNAVNGSGTTGDTPSSTSLSLTAATTTDIKAQTVSAVTLNVFPNPTANEINLQYFLHNTAKVIISLFDLNGKEVVVLCDQNQEAGMQTVNSQLSSELEKGVYIIKLSVNNKVATQKLFVKR